MIKLFLLLVKLLNCLSTIDGGRVQPKKEFFFGIFFRQSILFVNAQKPIVDYDVGDEKAVQLGQPKAMAQDPQ